MKPTLFILAAGMGSRYGGLKQLEKVGPNGETLMDYSIYDALKAGFGKIVFVIRKSFEKDFCEQIVKKYEKLVPVELVFQEVNNVPAGIKINPVREKPWGSSQALLMGKEVIKEPFGVINSDDFYGRESFQLLVGQLSRISGSENNYAMIPYRVGNTLVDTGGVPRAVCEVDENQYLVNITEREEVARVGGVPRYKDKAGNWVNLTDTTLVSMNMWAFTPDVFTHVENEFINFLSENKNDIKAELLLPTMINSLVETKKITVKAINTPAKWFGITYPKDKPEVMHKLQDLIADNIYPYNLF